MNADSVPHRDWHQLKGQRGVSTEDRLTQPLLVEALGVVYGPEKWHEHLPAIPDRVWQAPVKLPVQYRSAGASQL